ncbi:MAG: hypothetical protein GXP62_09285, partial [Oligoflexia bacterium]|nr:hypothetical protein [Oligoflexia bacterium]
MGVVSPLAVGTAATWTRVLAGDSAVGRIRRFDPTG